MVTPQNILISMNEELYWCLQMVIPWDTLTSYSTEYIRPSIHSYTGMEGHLTINMREKV